MLLVDKNNELLWTHYSNNHYGLSISYKIDIKEALKNGIFLFPVNYVDEIKGMNEELFENIKVIKKEKSEIENKLLPIPLAPVRCMPNKILEYRRAD